MSVEWQCEVHVPYDWILFDLDPSNTLSKLRSDVEKLYGDNHSRRERRAFVDAFSMMANNARERQARFAAVNRVEDGEIVYLATLNVYTVNRRHPESVDEELAWLLRGLSRRLAGDLDDPELGEVTLPSGRAVRRRVLNETEAEPGMRPAVLDTLGFWLPIPDDENLLYLTFATPTLAYADQYTEVFDEIAQAMEVTW